MRRSTFDPAVVRADGDYALPHAADLSGDLRPMTIEAEHDVLAPVRPAGGLWSTHTGDGTFRPNRARWRHRTKWHARGLRGEPGGDLGAGGGDS
jgi:hypothetical protein